MNISIEEYKAKQVRLITFPSGLQISMKFPSHHTYQTRLQDILTDMPKELYNRIITRKEADSMTDEQAVKMAEQNPDMLKYLTKITNMQIELFGDKLPDGLTLEDLEEEDMKYLSKVADDFFETSKKKKKSSSPTG